MSTNNICFLGEIRKILRGYPLLCRAILNIVLKRMKIINENYYYFRPPSTPRSTYQVLSSRKLAASIRSGSYLGRPSSTGNEQI